MSLAAVLGRRGEELAARLAEAPDWPARFAVLDQLLSRQTGQLPEPDPVLSYAWQRIVHSDRPVRVGELAAETGLSRQQLAERFRSEFGLGPKRVAVADRARTVGQSFFDPLPAGADLYLLNGILNDWPDRQTAMILRRCAEAAPPGARVWSRGGGGAARPDRPVHGRVPALTRARLTPPPPRLGYVRKLCEVGGAAPSRLDSTSGGGNAVG